MYDNEKLVYKIDGNMGKTLEVYENRCVISITSPKAILFGAGLNGEKEFYYSDVTSIQFKNLGMTTGFLQFEYAGSHSVNNFVNENSFTFSATIGTAKYKRLKEEMPPVYEYVQKRIREVKEEKNKQATIEISSVDEIRKYKELLDDGIISNEEFEAKKKQLLGL